jgi:peptidoglycan/xylan/chitin deacetylase (PgdA/CDA1 family)
MMDEEPRVRRYRSRASRRRRWLWASGGALLAAAAAAAAVVALRGGSGETPPAPAATRTVAHAAPAAPPATRRTHPVRERVAPPRAVGALERPAAPARASVRVPILMFHRVASEATATDAVSRSLTIPPEVFAAELRWLHDNGYHPVTLRAVFLALYEGAPLPARPLVLTFDDGYVDAVTTIAPLLRRYGWPATFFVITGRLGETAFLTWPEVRALDSAGDEIGSHTVDHVDLPAADAASRWAEVADSKRALERHLGHPVYWFAYPAGRYDQEVEADLVRAGYLLAVTTDPGSTISSASPMATPRVRIAGPGSVEQLAAAVRAAG